MSSQLSIVFTGSKFQAWKTRTLAKLRQEEVASAIEQAYEDDDDKREEKNDSKKDAKALSLILDRISDDVVEKLGTCETAQTPKCVRAR